MACREILTDLQQQSRNAYDSKIENSEIYDCLNRPYHMHHRDMGSDPYKIEADKVGFMYVKNTESWAKWYAAVARLMSTAGVGMWVLFVLQKIAKIDKARSVFSHKPLSSGWGVEHGGVSTLVSVLPVISTLVPDGARSFLWLGNFNRNWGNRVGKYLATETSIIGDVVLGWVYDRKATLDWMENGGIEATAVVDSWANAPETLVITSMIGLMVNAMMYKKLDKRLDNHSMNWTLGIMSFLMALSALYNIQAAWLGTKDKPKKKKKKRRHKPK